MKGGRGQRLLTEARACHAWCVPATALSFSSFFSPSTCGRSQTSMQLRHQKHLLLFSSPGVAEESVFEGDFISILSMPKQVGRRRATREDLTLPFLTMQGSRPSLWAGHSSRNVRLKLSLLLGLLELLTQHVGLLTKKRRENQ